ACLTHSGLALLGACLLLLLLCPEGHSQVSTATLVIAVEDQAGALVPDATITVLHTATGIARTVQSNDEGLATATALQPGVYDLTVEAGVPLVNTQNAELSEVVDERRVIELPLNGRNFMEFATLTTGITDGG